MSINSLYSSKSDSKNPQAAYKSGFKYGVHDARVTCKPDCREVYIFQPGKTFYFHTIYLMTLKVIIDNAFVDHR
ncbi:MAG: hypothetical protein WA395_14645 [Nitrososphaeraceae archaeon]